MRRLMLVVFLVGCGGDETGDGEARTPEDFLPEGVDISALTEAQQICVLYLAVGKARMVECDETGPFDWSPVEPFDEAAALRSCVRPDVTMEIYTPPGVSESVARCLDFRAAAPCAALAKETPDPTFHDCELVSPSW